MEITSLSFFHSQPFLVTCFCCLIAAVSLAARFSSSSSRRHTKTVLVSGDSSSSSRANCACNGVFLRSDCSDSSVVAVANGVVTGVEMPGVMADKLTGASMMEQLVPEITTHALSYLDYPSLCRLSMTNSLMRKAANDDNAWKALYHKDFTREQDSVRPVNGWKAYYAATRAIVNINAEFFNIIRERSLPAMSLFWLNADYVKCIHASGEIFSGYTPVMNSWQVALNWAQPVEGFQVRDVRVRVIPEMAWVTMKYINPDSGPYNVTNMFEFHDGRWFMVHHHCSVMLIDGEDQQIVHA